MKNLKLIPYFLLCMSIGCLIACSDDNGVVPEPDIVPDDTSEGYISVEATPDNWDGAKRADISYQILVYSFADSNGDKYGDINGLISKLDYINSLGVKAIWLSPIHPSPSYHGYDVIDYTKVNPKFGTDDDFNRLITEAHKRDIKIYLDYVLNHTSTEHSWFQQAKASAVNEFRNYYIFSQDPATDIREGKVDMISSESGKGYNAAEWFSVAGDDVRACYKFVLDWSNPYKPTVTVVQGNRADINENTAANTGNDRFIWFGKDVCKKFFDKGNGIFELTVDFISDWGFLIRTSDDPSWPVGTKYGAVSEDSKLRLGVPFVLNNSVAANIVFSNMDIWKYHSHFYTASFADLNYGKVSALATSPVFQEMTDAAKGWIDRGVDGFRLDAVKHIYHNAKSDENPVFLKKFYDELNTYYKGKGKTDELYVVGEVLSDAEEVAPYYKGLPALFEFSFWYRLEWAINNGTGRYFAKDILNNADHNLLGQDQTFTAKLQINAANCDYVDYALGNNVFYAKYLRPVSVDPSDVDELIDATNGASIAGLTLNLIDWRDKYFDKAEDTTGDDGKKYNFYGFYGVTKVAADIENATTTLNGGTLGSTKLSSVTKNVKLYFGEDKSTTNVFTALKVGDNGKFYYYNNGTTLGKFTIRVPLEVTYKWGTIYTEVDLNINKTIQN